ncbi:hypothetical protein ACQ4XT_00235 [Halobacillus faecis]
MARLKASAQPKLNASENSAVQVIVSEEGAGSEEDTDSDETVEIDIRKVFQE